MKKIAAIVLVLSLVLSLFAGCGENKAPAVDLSHYTEADSARKTSNAVKAAENPIELPENTLVTMRAKEFPLPGEADFFTLATSDDGFEACGRKTTGYVKLLLGGAFNTVGSEEISVDEHIECLLSTDDGEVYAVHAEDKLNADGSIKETCAVLRKDGERLYDIPWPNDFKPDSLFAMKAPEGLYVASLDWMILEGKEVPVPTLETEEGEIPLIVKGFLAFGEAYYVVFKRLHPVKEGSVTYIAPLKDGKCGVISEINMPGNAFWHGNGYGYYIVDDVLYRTDGKSITSCGDLLGMGVNVLSLDALLPLGEKVVLLAENRIILLEETGEENAENTIVVGGTRFGIIQDAIAAFNRGDHGFKVVTKQYRSLTALNLALVSHEVDVVYGLDASEMEKRARGGLFLPMNEFVDLAPMYPNVVKAGSMEDVCYLLPQSIMMLEGMLLPEELVPQRGYYLDTFELDEVLAALGSERFYKRSTREWMLDSFGRAGFEEWVDWDAMKAYFKDESFIRMLEICGRFAKDEAEVDGNQYSPNSLFIGNYQFFNILELKNFYEVNDGGINAGRTGNAAIFPEAGRGKYAGLSIRSGDLLAVPVGCPHPEETGEFLEFVFSEEEQKKITDFDAAGELSVLKTLSEETIERRIERLPDGTVWGYPMTEEEYRGWLDGMKALMAGADHYAKDEGAVREIVMEEGLRYFEGVVSAEKAAEYIQNRVQLYLDEQG